MQSHISHHMFCLIGISLLIFDFTETLDPYVFAVKTRLS